jgi:hypothetical protein
MINPMAKYVASRTLRGQLDWHAKVIDGDLAEGVSALKSEFRFWVHPPMWDTARRRSKATKP